MASRKVRASAKSDKVNLSATVQAVGRKRGSRFVLWDTNLFNKRLVPLAEFAKRLYGHDGEEVFAYEGVEGLGVYSHGRRVGPIPPAPKVLHIPDGFGLPAGEFVGTVAAVHHFGILVADHVAAVLAARHALRLDGGVA